MDWFVTATYIRWSKLIMNEHRRERAGKLKLSIVTSIGGRFSGVLLQVISLPIAAKSLGNEGFAVYSALVAVMSWLSLTNFGVGPALTVKISQALAKEDSLRAKSLYETASVLTLTVSLFIAFCLLLAIFCFDVSAHLFREGRASSSVGSEYNNSLIAVLFFFFLFSNLLIVEAAQLAKQEGYSFNLLSSIGVLVAAVAVFFVSKLAPNVLFVFLAANFPIALARIFNAYYFLSKNSIFRFGGFDVNLAKALSKEGIFFSVSGTLNNFVCHFFPIIVIGKVCQAEYAAFYAAIINSLLILSAVFGVTSLPLRGALPEAKVRQDYLWIRKAYFRVLSANVVYAVAVFFVFLFFGEQVFDFWYQGSLVTQRGVLWLAGLYFVLISLEYTNSSFLVALGLNKKSSLILLVKAAVFAVVFFAYVNANALAFPFLALLGANVIFSAFPLTFLCWRAVNK